MIKKVLALVCLALIYPSLSSPQMLRLESADSLRSMIIDGRVVRELVGHVKFTQGDMEMSCRRCLQYPEEKWVVFEGNVAIKDGQRTLTADRVFYYQQPEMEVAEGRVRIIDGDKILTADRVTYYEATKKIFAEGEAKLVDLGERTTLTADSIEYDRIKEHGVATPNPMLVREDTSSAEKLTITGDRMETFSREEKALVLGDVVITKGDLKAQCGEAEYLEKEEKIILRKKPVIFKQRDELRGRQIEIFLKDLKLQKLLVVKDALLISRYYLSGEEKEDSLSGEEIWMYFDGELIQRVEVEGRAISIYHLIEKGKDKGVNEAKGDKIVLLFEEGKVKKIRIESNPGMSSGKFIPIKWKKN